MGNHLAEGKLICFWLACSSWWARGWQQPPHWCTSLQHHLHAPHPAGLVIEATLAKRASSSSSSGSNAFTSLLAKAAKSLGSSGGSGSKERSLAATRLSIAGSVHEAAILAIYASGQAPLADAGASAGAGGKGSSGGGRGASKPAAAAGSMFTQQWLVGTCCAAGRGAGGSSPQGVRGAAAPVAAAVAVHLGKRGLTKASGERHHFCCC